MTLGLHLAGDSVIHRLPVGWKIGCLLLASTGLFLVSDPAWLALALAGVAILIIIARIPPAVMARQMAPALAILAILVAVQAIFASGREALALGLRFGALLPLACLVTFTSRVSDMIEFIERITSPLARIGIDPASVALALTLAIRFIPVLFQLMTEIRDAQRARGLDHSPLAFFAPLLIRTLKMAHEVSEAIEARGDPAPPDGPAGRSHANRR
jgi:biotin transport system permease protein